MLAGRIALIAVHGVADQKPGETARALTTLLVASPPADPAAPETDGTPTPRVQYRALAEERFEIGVDPLRPRGAATLPRGDATPLAEDRPLVKAFLQSFRSDLQRAGWRAASSARDAMRQSRAVRPEDAADRGLATTNYLLTKHIDNGAQREAYPTSRITLQRDSLQGRTAIDVYEMYWADLSRLSGQLPRIVTELFTMVFRLSKLGRDTVDEARARFARQRGTGWTDVVKGWLWWLVGTSQAALDWLFVNGLALLSLQLLLLVVVLAGLGLVLALDPTTAHAAICGTVAVGGLLWLVYHLPDLRSKPLPEPASEPVKSKTSGAPAAALTRLKTLVLPAAVLALGAASLVWWDQPYLWTSTVALLVVAIAIALSEVGLRVGTDRFPFLRTVGRCLGAATLLLLLAALWKEFATAPLDPAAARAAIESGHFALHGWAHAALFATEAVLAAVKVWWIFAGLLLAFWFVLGFLLSWGRDYASKASIATGRLGLAISLGTFLTLTMAGWALLTKVIDLSAVSVSYSPCIFAIAPTPATAEAAGRSAPAARPGASAAASVAASPAASGAAFVAVPPAASAPGSIATPASNACLWTDEEAEQRRGGAGRVFPSPTAGAYLKDRFAASTENFAVLAVLLALLVLYLAVMFLPSILAELKVLVQSKRQAFMQTVLKQQRQEAEALRRKRDAPRNSRLGRWLTRFYRGLDGAVLLITGLGVLAGVVVAAIFSGHLPSVVAIDTFLGAFNWDVAATGRFLRRLSQAQLEPLIISAAGIATALTLLGGVLSKYAPAIRAPLDIALDVDNYFRDFPRTDIARARIFSRYAALLAHIESKGYDGVVIVAHSQGSVISAELLRFLSSDGHRPPPQSAAGPILDGKPLPPISLLTVGCPLRQLYAARFPCLYPWVLEPRDGVSGPLAADIGVVRWANAFCSGDYVGRWLRSDSAKASDPVGHPMTDLVDNRGERGLGRVDAYSAFVPMPPLANAIAGRREFEVCLGLGAHTHYLEVDQDTVAWLVDYLVRGAGGAGPGHTLRADDRGSRAACERHDDAAPALRLARPLAWGLMLAVLWRAATRLAKRWTDSGETSTR